MNDQRFEPRSRIRRGIDFQRVYRRRVKASDSSMIVCGCQNGLGWPRLGLSVSRKVGGAVTRNRWKRLLREAFRLTRPNLPQGIDLVVIPRPGVEPELRQLQRSLARLAANVARRLAKDRR